MIKVINKMWQDFNNTRKANLRQKEECLTMIKNQLNNSSRLNIHTRKNTKVKNTRLFIYISL